MADTDQSKKKRLTKIVADELSMVFKPANDEEFLILKSMDAETDIAKQAAAHEQLLKEQTEALKKATDEVAANAMDMDVEELNGKLRQISDLSWSIRDLANTVNISKSGDGTMPGTSNESAATPTPQDESMQKLQALLKQIGELGAEIGKSAEDNQPAGSPPAGSETPPATPQPPAAGSPSDGVGSGQGASEEDLKKQKQGEYPVPGDAKKLGEIKALVTKLAALIEELTKKNVEKGVKQMSKERQATIVSAIKGLAELVKEVDPSFDPSSLLTPPEPASDVEKAVAGIEKSLDEKLAAALKPLQEQVEKMAGAQGVPQAAPSDRTDTPEDLSKSQGDKLWSGSALG